MSYELSVPSYENHQNFDRLDTSGEFSVEQRQALPHLAVSGSLTGGEPMSKCDCPEGPPGALDETAQPCYRLPMTKTRYPRHAAGSPVPRHAGEPAGGASHTVPFSSETVSSTSRPRLILKRESKLNAPKRDRMMLAWWSKDMVERGVEDNPVAESLRSCRTPAGFVLHRRCSPVARRSLPSYDIQQNPTVCNRFQRLHANPAGAVGALTLSRGRC